MKKTLFTLILFVITNCILAMNNQSQKVKSNKSLLTGFAINLKAGTYNWTMKNEGFIGGFEASVFKSNIIYAIEYLRAEEFTLSNSTPIATYNQADFLFGKQFDKNIFRFQIQGGLGAFWGVKSGKLIETGSGFFPDSRYQEQKFTTIGIPLKIGLKIMPAKFMSFGFDLQANINSENPLYMILLSVEFGKIRK